MTVTGDKGYCVIRANHGMVISTYKRVKPYLQLRHISRTAIIVGKFAYNLFGKKTLISQPISDSSLLV